LVRSIRLAASDWRWEVWRSVGRSECFKMQGLEDRPEESPGYNHREDAIRDEDVREDHAHGACSVGRGIVNEIQHAPDWNYAHDTHLPCEGFVHLVQGRDRLIIPEPVRAQRERGRKKKAE
jgi:hypothetical protein